MDAIGIIFYGVKISRKKAISLIHKHLDENEYNFSKDDDLHDSEIYELLECLPEVKSPTLECGYTNNTPEFAIAAFKQEQFHGNNARDFSMPTQEELDKNWIKIKSTYKINKKPKWHIYANSF